MTVAPHARPPIERFVEKIVVADSGCWEWQASAPPPGFYGIFSVGSRSTNDRKRVYAHRWSYEHFVGPIPEGLTIDHLCRNRACVNPDHLEAVTPRVNVLRGDTVTARNAVKTHCLNGHEFSAENTRRAKDGSRVCKACMREHMRRFRTKAA